MPLPTSGLEIPIVKLTVDHMQTVIMQALSPEVLAQQLDAACKKALCEINFEQIISDTVIRLADIAVNSDAVCEPLREYLDTGLQTALAKILPPVEEE